MQNKNNGSTNTVSSIIIKVGYLTLNIYGYHRNVCALLFKLREK